MSEKPTLWHYTTTAIVALLCLMWAVYEYRAAPEKPPFEPIVAFVTGVFVLWGYRRWIKIQEKPDATATDSANVQANLGKTSLPVTYPTAKNVVTYAQITAGKDLHIGDTYINQTHSNTGDNVARDKIDRQINMGSGSNYIEYQQNTPVQPANKPIFSDKDTINDLVVRGQLTAALDKLRAQIPDEQNTIIVLKSRVSQLERSEMQGVLSNEDANIERNRIKTAILSLLNRLS